MTGVSRGTRPRPNPWLRAGLAAALGGTALLAAACGGGSHAGPSASPARGTTQQMVAFAQCLRGHGEPDAYLGKSSSAADAPNSAVHIRGYNITGTTPGTAQFASAMKACHHLIPFAPPQPMTEQQKDHELKFAACMRSHGYPGYPDPQFQNGGMVEQPLPSSIDTASPRFQAAEKTCSGGS